MFGKKDNTTDISDNLLYKTALETSHIGSAVLASSPKDIDEALLLAAKLEDSNCLFNLLFDKKIRAYFIEKLDKKDENVEKLIHESRHFDVADLFQETIKTEAVHRIENKVKKTSEKNMITEAMECLALSEAEQGVREVRYESNYISSELTHKPSSPIMLLALKCRNRLQKNQVFNGFVLKRSYGKKSCEFEQFSNELHASIKNIPPNTRLQLAVEIRDTFNHWTAVDLFIDQSGVLHSFVLDASNHVLVSENLSKVLANQFPNGKHYIYKAQQRKPIHADSKSCLIFTLSHLTQLSKINSADLYVRELPAIAVPPEQSPYSAYSVILTEKFVAGSLLIPLIRSAQTTQKLQDGILDSFIKNGVTLRQGKVSIREKGRHLQIKKISFIKKISDRTIERIFESRNGFIYLRNPCLFKLKNALASITEPQHLCEFIHKLNEKIPNLADEIQELAFFDVIVSSEQLASKKHDILLLITHLFYLFEEKQAEEMKNSLQTIVENFVLNVFQLRIKLWLEIIQAKKAIGCIRLNYLTLSEEKRNELITTDDAKNLSLIPNASQKVIAHANSIELLIDKEAILCLLLVNLAAYTAMTVVNPIESCIEKEAILYLLLINLAVYTEMTIAPSREEHHFSKLAHMTELPEKQLAGLQSNSLFTFDNNQIANLWSNIANKALR